MKNPKQEKVPDPVETLANELVEEFWEHVAECKRANPTMSDSNVIFQGWAIQKIAGLYSLTLTLSQQVAQMQARKN